VLQIDI